MSLLIILLPLLNFLLLTSATSFVHWRHLIALVLVSKSLVVGWSAANFEKMIRGETHVAKIGEWFDFGLLNVGWTFSIDSLTHVMIFTVMLVSTLVHNYSTAYMSEDPHLPRFLSYLSLFTFFMLILVSSDNFVGLFLGWEGVGLCSYLLISFWFTRLQANKAAIKAMIVNRIADMGLTLGILAIFYTFQSVEFNIVLGLVPYTAEITQILVFCREVDSNDMYAALLFIGAMGKSAQLGLHTWLPDAMEGPSPVSALIHAATMVTAGIFLIIRCSALYEFAPRVLDVITVIGAATALMAATSGVLQNDLKKVIAYSTCSQLGYMFFACGRGQFDLALLHLVNHAFFKALLFLTAGAVIHGVSNEQDTRKFGGLSRLLPFTYVMFLIGSLALMGFPFLTGYYSKDTILEIAACGQTILSAYAYLLGLVTALFTAYYSFRQLKLTFYGISRSPRAYLLHTHELVADMAYPLAVLAIGSIFFGYFARDLFIGFGSGHWSGIIADSVSAVIAHREGEFLILPVKVIPLVGMAFALDLIVFQSSRINSHPLLQNSEGREAYHFFAGKWHFDPVNNKMIVEPAAKGSYQIFALIDKGLLETFGPTGAGQLAHRGGVLLARFQTGRVFDYALMMLAGLLLALLLKDCVTNTQFLQSFVDMFSSPKANVSSLDVAILAFEMTLNTIYEYLLAVFVATPTVYYVALDLDLRFWMSIISILLGQEIAGNILDFLCRLANRSPFLFSPRMVQQMGELSWEEWAPLEAKLQDDIDNSRAELAVRYPKEFSSKSAEEFDKWSRTNPEAAAKYLADKAKAVAAVQAQNLVEAEAAAAELAKYHQHRQKHSELSLDEAKVEFAKYKAWKWERELEQVDRDIFFQKQEEKMPWLDSQNPRAQYVSLLEALGFPTAEAERHYDTKVLLDQRYEGFKEFIIAGGDKIDHLSPEGLSFYRRAFHFYKLAEENAVPHAIAKVVGWVVATLDVLFLALIPVYAFKVIYKMVPLPEPLAIPRATARYLVWKVVHKVFAYLHFITVGLVGFMWAQTRECAALDAARREYDTWTANYIAAGGVPLPPNSVTWLPPKTGQPSTHRRPTTPVTSDTSTGPPRPGWRAEHKKRP